MLSAMVLNGSRMKLGVLGTRVAMPSMEVSMPVKKVGSVERIWG